MTLLDRNNVFHDPKLGRESNVDCTAVDVACLCSVGSVPKVDCPFVPVMKYYEQVEYDKHL